MFIRTTTTIALYCVHCGKIELHDISLFQINKHSLTLFCSCGKMQGTVSRNLRGFYLLKIPCVICDTTHLLSIESKKFWCVKLDKLYCTHENIEIGFIGKRSNIEKQLETYKHELEVLCQEMNDDEDVCNPPVMFEILNMIHDYAENDKIYCTCGSHIYDIEVLNDSIELRCSDCNSHLVINACTEEDAKKLKDNHIIEIPGNYLWYHK